MLPVRRIQPFPRLSASGSRGMFVLFLFRLVAASCVSFARAQARGLTHFAAAPLPTQPAYTGPVRGTPPKRTREKGAHSAECPCLRRRAFRAGTSSPRMPPSALRGGSFARFSGLLSPARNVSTLTPPGFAPPGVTSNKGGRSLVLTNFGPLRPPVRRTSAPLRCSSSPNGNGRFRWERSRSEISELSPLGGSKRYAACGDAFGRWGVVLRRGNTKSPS